MSMKTLNRMSSNAEQAVGILSILKSGKSDHCLNLGMVGGKIKTFIVSSNKESDLQSAAMLLDGTCDKIKVINLKELRVSQFREMLSVSGLNPDEIIMNSYEVLKSVGDDYTNTMFSDKSCGALLTVVSIKDDRTLQDYVNGNDQVGIKIEFACADKDTKSKLIHKEFPLSEVSNMVSEGAIVEMF